MGIVLSKENNEANKYNKKTRTLTILYVLKTNITVKYVFLICRKNKSIFNLLFITRVFVQDFSFFFFLNNNNRLFTFCRTIREKVFHA